MKKLFTSSLLYFIIVLQVTLSAQVSPFGTGKVDDIYIGEIEDVSVIEHSTAGYTKYTSHPNDYLIETETEGENAFDLYIPPSYDGTEPYGLMTWISSGKNGIIRNQWKTVADEKKIIFIGANGLGNTIITTDRIGAAVASAFRMRELFNIDENRIYASGNSGGARVAANMAFLFPEWIAGSLCLCGSSYFNDVQRDYQTRTDEYENIITYQDGYKDYVKTFDQRYAIMTSYEDFREGNIMNIYHNGMEVDNFKSKILENEGGHCATNTIQFRNAVNFVEHSFRTIIRDEFDSGIPEVGTGYILDNAVVESGQLNLSATGTKAQLKTRDLFYWNDPKGIILKTKINPKNNNANLDNTIFNLGLWEYTDEDSYLGVDGITANETTAGIILTAKYSGNGIEISVKTSNPNNSSTTETIFTGIILNDERWTVQDEFKIKYFLWDTELRIELGAHFVPENTTVVNGVKLLDDNRSIRIEWDKMNANGYWADTQWVDGAFMTMATTKEDYNLASENILVKDISLISEKPSESLTLSNNEMDLENSRVGVYPNITSDELKIVFDDFKQSEKFKLEIYNTSGQMLKTIQLRNDNEIINISNLDKGMYVFKVYNSFFSEYKRIIKK